MLDRTGGSGSYRTLEWNVYGKLSQVQSGPTRTTYDYDAQGNRIHKVFTTSDGESEQHVYYVRDAQGNVLAVYEQRLSARYSAANSALTLTEQPIYGSSRLGLRKLGAGTAPPSAATAYFARSLGQKQYELTDHLGNVRALLSDVKRPEAGGTYKPELLAYYGYYPFGMLQPGRSAPANATLAGGYLTAVF